MGAWAIRWDLFSIAFVIESIRSDWIGRMDWWGKRDMKICECRSLNGFGYWITNQNIFNLVDFRHHDEVEIIVDSIDTLEVLHRSQIFRYYNIFYSF